MTIKKITQEQFDNDDYPMCRRCISYHNLASTIFGSGWDCQKGHSFVEVDDNHFDVTTTGVLEIHDCGDYEFGETTTVVIG